MEAETKTPPAGEGEGARGESWGKSHRNSKAADVQTSIPPIIDLALGRLECVRKSGNGYTARCPAHEDRTASLSIAAGDDGRLLLHCFAGCSVHNVVGAIGLAISDLFPQRLKDASPEARKELQGLALKSRLQACINVLHRESSVILIAAGDLDRGQVLTVADHARLALAAQRISDARVALGSTR